MDEEEKRAIEWLKNATFFSARIYAPSILNLIEKQRKEIEELKKPKYLYNANTGEITRIENEKGIDKNKIEELSAEIEELKKDKKALVDNYNKVLGNFISKDTIREKIKEISSYTIHDKEEERQQDYAIERLKELLEE